jgi:hypothetical protein
MKTLPAWMDPLKTNSNVEIISPFDQTIFFVSKSFVVLGMIWYSFLENKLFEHR